MAVEERRKTWLSQADPDQQIKLLEADRFGSVGSCAGGRVMDHTRQFTRPLMARCAGHSAALVQLLADRSEDHPDLARHLLAALDDLRTACDLDMTGTPEPAILQK